MSPAPQKQKKSAQAVQNDDGFIFRTRSTRSSKAVEAAQSTQTIPSSSQPSPVLDPPKRKALKKRTITSPSPVGEPKKAKTTEGNEKRASSPAMVDEQVKARKKKGKKDEKTPAPSLPRTLKTGCGDADATKVVLPISDTPIIRRNQQLRKGQGNRRSSVGMRGRRASSLMDTGVIGMWSK